MKKEYLIPTIKTMRLPEVMQAPINNSEIDPEEFEWGAKETDVEDDFSPVFDSKSVWED